MKDFKSSLVVFSAVLLLFSQKITAGDVIIVNRCNEPLGFVHVKDIKGKKKYNSKPELKNEKLIEDKSKVKVKKDRELGVKKVEKLQKDELSKGEVKVGEFFILRDIDFTNNEKVYVKGISWKRIKGTKAHYKSLHLQEGDHIVFIDNSERGLIYGGKLDRKSIKIESKKEELITKLNYIYSDIMPFVKKLSELNDGDLKSRGIGNLEKDLEKIETYVKAIKNIKILEANYSSLIGSIDLLIIRIRVALGKENPETLISKKVKNLKQEDYLTYSAIVRGLINGKVDLDKNLESYKNEEIKTILLVAQYMDQKGEIYTKEDKNILANVIGKGNWKIAKRAANESTKNIQENIQANDKSKNNNKLINNNMEYSKFTNGYN